MFSVSLNNDSSIVVNIVIGCSPFGCLLVCYLCLITKGITCSKSSNVIRGLKLYANITLITTTNTM